MEDIQHSLDVATRFLETVDLPKAVKSFEEEGLPLDLSRPVFDQVKEQSIVIGSQLAGFSSDVPVKLRPMISNVFLLAQLVADKKTQHAASGSKQWYDTYLETLTKVGWTVSGMSDAEQIISGSALEVHKEIIPVIVAALGPAAAAASTIVRVSGRAWQYQQGSALDYPVQPEEPTRHGEPVSIFPDDHGGRYARCHTGRVQP